MSLRSSNITINHHDSLIQLQTHSKINELIQNFEKISSSIQMDSIKNYLLEEDKAKQIKVHDSQMVLARLRNVENRAEINRAETELIIQRKSKRYSFHSKTSRNHKHQSELESYQNIYTKYKKEEPFQYQSQEVQNVNSDQESEECQEKGPDGVQHYNFLKKHPMLLSFTLQQIQKKNKSFQIMQKNIMKEQFKIQSSKGASMSQEYQEIRENSKSNQNQQSNESLAETKLLSKFYSKSSSGRLDNRVKQNNRCAAILQKQDRIIGAIEDKKLSKENLQKLKLKMNEIVNELHKNDRKRKDMLPMLKTSR